MSSQFVGFTLANPTSRDGATVIGFQNRPDLDRTLGATSFMFDTTTGAIVESDIFFNTAFPWSVSPQGETGLFDLQSIALHEIGHLHGLAHSAMGETELRAGGRRVIAAEAVMFPIAFSSGTILGPHAEGGRHCRHRRHLSINELHAGHRQHQRQGHQGRQGRAGRARHRLRHAQRRRSSAAFR